MPSHRQRGVQSPEPMSVESNARVRGATRPEIVLDITHEDGAWDDVAGVQELAVSAANAASRHPALAGRLPSEACLALSSDDTVRRLNKSYRGQDKPTNVLSFPVVPTDKIVDPSGDRGFIGDIVIASGVLRREASELGIPIEHHLQHLVVHGLLHLLGFDHEDDLEAETMERTEAEILAMLGIPDPYSNDAE